MVIMGGFMEKHLFISHASDDIKLVTPLAKILDDFFAGGVKVDVSSIHGTIPQGANWFEWINTQLAGAKVLIFLITPNSISRPWVWYELGATWARHQAGEVAAIPVSCCLNLKSLPAPFNAIQGVDLQNKSQTQVLLKQLSEAYGVGKYTPQRAKRITDAANKYCAELEQQTHTDKTIQATSLTAALSTLVTLGLIKETALDVLVASDVLSLAQRRELTKQFHGRGQR